MLEKLFCAVRFWCMPETLVNSGVAANVGIADATETVEKLNDAKESLQEVAENPGMVRTWLEGLVPDLLSFALQVVIAIIVYAAGARLIKWILKMLKKSMERRNADVGLIQFLSAVVKYSLYFILVMVILNLFGIATTSVVAVLGSAGVAVGLALQGSLSNFAGGVLILLLKPFKVGDYIIQGTNEGVVFEISIFYTKLHTGDNKMVVIPNGELSNTSLINVSHMEKRRVDIVVGIAYEADIRTAKNVLYELAQNDEARLPEEDAVVFVSDLGASAVDIGVRVWVKAEDYWSAKWRLTEQIKYSLDEHNIPIPYQQIDVQIKQ
jgi:small conductance mechanosensitive channel